MEVIFLLSVFFLGFFFIKKIIGDVSNILIYFSLQTGIGIIVLISTVLYTTGLGIPLYFSFIFGYFFIVIMFFKNKEYGKIDWLNIYKKYSKFIIITLFIAFFLYYLGHYVAYQSDSFSHFEGLGRVFAIEKKFIKEKWFLSKAFFEPIVPFMHGIAYSLNIEHINSLYPIVGIFLGYITIYFSSFSLLKLKNKLWIVLLNIGGLLLIFNNYYVFESMIILPNVIGSLFLSSSLYLFFILNYKENGGNLVGNNNKSMFVVFSLMLAFSSMVRAEFKLFNLVPIFLTSKNKKEFYLLLLIYIPIAYLWDFSRLINYYYIININDIETYIKLLIYVDSFTLFLIGLILLIRRKIWELLSDNTIYIIFYSISLTIMFLSYLFNKNLYVTVINNLIVQCLDINSWGTLWYILIPLIIISFIIDKNNKRRNEFLMILTTFFCFRILAYFYFHNSVSDKSILSSGNRILIHIFPFMIFYSMRILSEKIAVIDY